MGRFDQHGYLYLTDRKKDLILVSGSNVYGSEVEEVLSKHPAIMELAIIGTPLVDEGEQVTAVVVVQEGLSLSLDNIREFCAPQLAAFMLPTRLELTESLPRTSVWKAG